MNIYDLDLTVQGLTQDSQVAGFTPSLPYNGYLSGRLPQVTFAGGIGPQGVPSARPLAHTPPTLTMRSPTTGAIVSASIICRLGSRSSSAPSDRTRRSAQSPRPTATSPLPGSTRSRPREPTLRMTRSPTSCWARPRPFPRSAISVAWRFMERRYPRISKTDGTSPNV